MPKNSPVQCKINPHLQIQGGGAGLVQIGVSLALQGQLDKRAGDALIAEYDAAMKKLSVHPRLKRVAALKADIDKARAEIDVNRQQSETAQRRRQAAIAAGKTDDALELDSDLEAIGRRRVVASDRVNYLSGELADARREADSETSITLASLQHELVNAASRRRDDILAELAELSAIYLSDVLALDEAMSSLRAIRAHELLGRNGAPVKL